MGLKEALPDPDPAPDLTLKPVLWIRTQSNPKLLEESGSGDGYVKNHFGSCRS
jgi:hypothetical protein